jgi:heme o synthase
MISFANGNRLNVKPIKACRPYLSLCKGRVVLLMQLTALVGMILAPHNLENPFKTGVIALIGIGLACAAGACCNHLLDQHIDRIMKRTLKRPLPQGTLSTQQALIFCLFLLTLSMLIMLQWVNPLACLLTLAATIGYGLIYTVVLKKATPQNIVIGGLSGALPPLLGWVSMTGSITYEPWLLVLIVFAWTPPHFWALAIHRYEDYKKADIPMLPITHGIPYTKQQITLYSMLLIIASLLPYCTTMLSVFYLTIATILNTRLLYDVYLMYTEKQPNAAHNLFFFSIKYLGYLFAAMIIDTYWVDGLSFLT